MQNKRIKNKFEICTFFFKSERETKKRYTKQYEHWSFKAKSAQGDNSNKSKLFKIGQTLLFLTWQHCCAHEFSSKFWTRYS